MTLIGEHGKKIVKLRQAQFDLQACWFIAFMKLNVSTRNKFHEKIWFSML